MMLYLPTVGSPNVRGKRQRPKFSLKSQMFRKHTVLKFLATGPLDTKKTHYKWWCRLCKVELSLMRRGVLEFLSHYRTEFHLIKEDRIRMDIPGMPLFDREERELQGVPLSEAKKSQRHQSISSAA